MEDYLKHVSICIVNYNGREYLPACLDAVLATCSGVYEIIVVDNASRDSSADLVARNYPQVKLVKLSENLGPGAARNVAWAKSSGSQVLFIDNDVRLTEGCVERLLETLGSHPDAAVAMPRICYAARPDTIQYDGAGCHPTGLMTLHNHNVAITDAGTSTQYMHSVVTACILVDRKMLGMDQPFDESFFFNYEDHDFGLRCSLSGRRIISVPAALCYHESGTEGLSYRENGSYTNRRAYYLIRNRWLILLKNYQLRTLVILSPVLVLFEIFQLIGLTVKGWGMEWLNSVWWIIVNLPGILRKRRVVQKTRMVADMELFEMVPLPLTDRMAGGRITRAGISFLDRTIFSYWKLIQPARQQRGYSRD